MRSIVLIASIAAAMASAAHAQTPVEDPSPVAGDKVSWGVGAATGYLFETQAFLIEGPVVNAWGTYDLGHGFSVTGWGQVGEDELAREFDIIAVWNGEVGNVELTASAAAYLYPSGGSQPIYAIGGEASIPMGPVSLELSVDHYEGALESTVYTAAMSRSFGNVNVTLGRSYNDPEDIAPWFARLSVPVVETGIRLGARGFWGADSGMVVEVARDF